MPLLIRTVIRRYMVQTSNFEFDSVRSAVTQVAGHVLGTYRDPQGDLIVFTADAILHGQPDALHTIKYSEILGFDHPETTANIDGVLVKTPAGKRFIKISGTHGREGKYKDALSFIMFLRTIARANRTGTLSEDQKT